MGNLVIGALVVLLAVPLWVGLCFIGCRLATLAEDRERGSWQL